MFRRRLLNRQPQHLAQSRKQVKNQRCPLGTLSRVKSTPTQNGYHSEESLVLSSNIRTTGPPVKPVFQQFVLHKRRPGQLYKLNLQSGYLQIIPLSSASVGGFVDEQKMFIPLLTSTVPAQGQVSPWVYSAHNVERWNAALTGEVVGPATPRARRPRFLLSLRLSAKERAMFNWVRYYGPRGQRQVESTAQSGLQKVLPDNKALQVVYGTGSLLQWVLRGGWWVFWGTLTYPTRRVAQFSLFFSDLMIMQGKGTFRGVFHTLYHDWIWHCGRSRTFKLREALWIRVTYTWNFLINRWALQSYEYALNGLNTPRFLGFLLPIIVVGWGLVRASTEISLTRGSRILSLHEGWTARPMTLAEQDIWTSALASHELQLTNVTSKGPLTLTKQTIWQVLEPEELLILEPKHTGMDEQLFMPQRVLGVDSLTNHQVFEKLRCAELDWDLEQQWDETHWSQDKLTQLTPESYEEEVETDVIALLNSGLFEERLGILDPSERPLLRAVDNIGAEDDLALEDIEVGEEDDDMDAPRRKRTKLIGESSKNAEMPLPALPDSPPKIEKINADLGFPCFTADGHIYHSQLLWPACRLGIDSLPELAPRHFDLPTQLTKNGKSSSAEALIDADELEQVPASTICDTLAMFVEPAVEEEPEVDNGELAVILPLQPSSNVNHGEQVQVQLSPSARQLFSNYPQARVGTDALAQAVPSFLQRIGLSQWTLLPPYSLSTVDILEQLVSGHALQDLPVKNRETNPDFPHLGTKQNIDDLEEYLDDQEHRVEGATEFHVGLDQIDGVLPALSGTYIIDARPGLLKYLPSLEEVFRFPRPMWVSFDSLFFEGDDEDADPGEDELFEDILKSSTSVTIQEESDLVEQEESDLVEQEESDLAEEEISSHSLTDLSDSPLLPDGLPSENECEEAMDTREVGANMTVGTEGLGEDFAFTLRDRSPHFWDSSLERSQMDEGLKLARSPRIAIRAVENKVMFSQVLHLAFKFFELALLGVCYRVWLTGFIEREDENSQIQHVLWHVGRLPRYRASYAEIVGLRSSKMGLYHLVLGFQNYRLRTFWRPSELVHCWEAHLSPLIPPTVRLTVQHFWNTQYPKMFPPKLHSFRMLEQAGVGLALRRFYTRGPAKLPTSAYFVRRPRQVHREWKRTSAPKATWGPRVLAVIESDLRVRIPREFVFSLFHGLIHPNPTQLVHLPRGLVISGIIGNGDGFIARAVASETRQPLFKVEGNRFLDPMEGVDYLIRLFEFVRRNAPNILYFDTLELLAKDRQLSTSAQTIRLTNQFLICLDGFNSGGEAGPSNNRVFVMASTQSMAVIDRACLRSGRFEWVLDVGFPNQGERIKLFRMYTARTQVPVHVDLNWKYFALLAEGYTCSQIRAVILGSVGKFKVGQTIGGHSDTTFFYGMHQANRLMKVFGDDLVKEQPVGLFEQASTLNALLPQSSKGTHDLEARIPINTLTLVLGLVFSPSLWGPQPLSAIDVYASSDDFLLTSCLLFTSEVFLLKRAAPAWQQAGLRLNFDTYVESLGQRAGVDLDRTMRPYLLDQLFAPSQHILPVWIEEWFDMLVPPLEARDRENISEVSDLDVVEETGPSRTKTLESWLYARTFYDGLYLPATVDLTSYLPLSILPYANVNTGFDLFTEWTSLFGAELGLSFPGTYLDYPHIRASYGTEFFRLQFRRPVPPSACLQDPYVFTDQPAFTSGDSVPSTLPPSAWYVPEVDTPKQDSLADWSIDFDGNGNPSIQGIDLMGQYTASTRQVLNKHDGTTLGFDVDSLTFLPSSQVCPPDQLDKPVETKIRVLNGLQVGEEAPETAVELPSLSSK